ncbi:DUF3270 family protein [Streptococcus hillyeri]|uniref:DUF3270 family protein n=1 Tax=Streptococcus hillyeri TaxID=2282420 RepID=A0A3L9DY67_9STRE|nr:DUF3270 family protein [Streptococcus hillyeri]RLY05228.1 DUF3270 family protein [Streptococcus hillyeri]
MAAPLKHQDQSDKVVSISKKTEPKFKTYDAINPNATKFKDLVFFGRIVSFTICTVFSCLTLLTASVTPLLAFPIAMVMGSILTAIFYFLIDLLKR